MTSVETPGCCYETLKLTETLGVELLENIYALFTSCTDYHDKESGVKGRVGGWSGEAAAAQLSGERTTAAALPRCAAPCPAGGGLTSSASVRWLVTSIRPGLFIRLKMEGMVCGGGVGGLTGRHVEVSPSPLGEILTPT